MKLLRNAASVSTLTGLCRVLGLWREVMMAGLFGTSLAKSAFDLAFRIPNLFRAIFGEGALTQAFVPVFTRTREQNGLQTAREYAGKLITALAAILTTITALSVLIMQLIRPSLEYGSRPEMVLRLLIILFPYLIFLCLAAAFVCIHNSMGKFAIPAFGPILLNVVWIGTLAYIIPTMQESLSARITILAWAIVLAGLLQMLFQLVPFIKNGYGPRLSLQWKDSRLKETLHIFIPAAASNGIRHINSLIDGVLALWIGAWAPASLVFAERLAFLPLGLFATALGTVLLPELSKLAVTDPDNMKKTLQQAMNASLIIMMPAAAGLAVLAFPIIQVIYENGAFDAESTRLTGRALIAYAPGLVTFSLYKMLLPAFHAHKDTKTPMLSAAGAVILNVCLNLLLIQVLPLQWRHAGLAGATVIASIVNTTTLAIILHRRSCSPNWKAIGTTFIRITICTAIMIIAILAMQSQTQGIDTTTKAGQTTNIVILIATGIVAYSISMLVICRREIQALHAARKNGKTNAIQ